MFILTALALYGLTISQPASAASGADWRSRSIYQIVTDRFARPDGSTTAACNAQTGVYCNGTWQGIISKLDYVQGMGFDAIWISPVTKQVEGNSGDGTAYHGYWQTDIYDVNSHFGTADDLRNLAAEVHARGMYFMVDIVTNHFAQIAAPADIDYSVFNPFNDQSYFHDYCKIDYSTDQLANTTNMETCWEGDSTVPLADLRTEDSDVSSVWTSWVAEFVSNYSIDGLRIDSVLEVDTAFWSSFQSAAGVYSLGEVNAADISLVCSFQDHVPGVFNYGTYFNLIDAFQSTTGSIDGLVQAIAATQGGCADVSLLGTFSENHDVPRFAFLNDDLSAAKNVIAFTMLTDGIPVIYQGQEQHYDAQGSSDGSVPYNREALWLSGYSTTAPLYQHIAALNAIRKQITSVDAGFPTTPAAVTYADLTNLGLQKADLVLVLTNQGAASSNYTLSIPSSLRGTAMTELLSCDTLTTDDQGRLAVPLVQGLPRVYLPTASVGALCGGGGGGGDGKRDLVRSRHFRAAWETPGDGLPIWI